VTSKDGMMKTKASPKINSRYHIGKEKERKSNKRLMQTKEDIFSCYVERKQKFTWNTCKCTKE